MDFHAFYRHSDWRAFEDTSLPISMKLWRAAHLAAAIGCIKLDENSIARLTRLIMHVDSPNREWQVVDALNQLKTLKQHLARLGSAPQVDTTPESPELLRRTNPLVFANVYNTEGPTACPVSKDTLSYIYSQASCRSTKKRLDAIARRRKWPTA